MTTVSPRAHRAPPGLARRLAAGFYDLLLVIALWFPATALALFVFRDGRRLPEAGYQLYLLAVGFAFFGWFWTHGGQTLGMRAWRLKLVSESGGPLGWYHALVRYLTMLIPWLLIGLGLEFVTYPVAAQRWLFQDLLAPAVFLAGLLGFVWPRLNAERLAWHDGLSRSRLVALPRPVRADAADSPPATEDSPAP